MNSVSILRAGTPSSKMTEEDREAIVDKVDKLVMEHGLTEIIMALGPTVEVVLKHIHEHLSDFLKEQNEDYSQNVVEEYRQGTISAVKAIEIARGYLQIADHAKDMIPHLNNVADYLDQNLDDLRKAAANSAVTVKIDGEVVKFKSPEDVDRTLEQVRDFLRKSQES